MALSSYTANQVTLVYASSRVKLVQAAITADYLDVQLGSAAQAIYRWNGSQWEQVKASYWNGSQWVLV